VFGTPIGNLLVANPYTIQRMACVVAIAYATRLIPLIAVSSFRRLIARQSCGVN
jgi:hypothetical protein